MPSLFLSAQAGYAAPHGARVNNSREPILNVPAVVIFVLAVLVAVHVVRWLVLSDEADRIFLLTFAFIPVRYDAALDGVLPGGAGAQIWTFVTYALIHADVTHLGFNAIWLLA